MPNTYFQFKQFTVHQDKCAMKVCTDACLFGAWITDQLINEKKRLTQILDIGTGTGLLGLMIAQVSDASIDAIEIDTEASQQARENFAASPWKHRLKVIHTDVKDLHAFNKYDLIVSNPPFYDNDLKSAEAARNAALHSIDLSFVELLDVVNNNLSDDGVFVVLLPYYRSDEFKRLAAAEGLFIQKWVNVKQTEKHRYFRAMLWMTRQETTCTTRQIIIKESGEYSEDFKRFLSNYYLSLA